MTMDKKTLLSGISEDWCKILDCDLLDEVIESLEDEDQPIVPCVNKIFEFARLTKLDSIKVVIIGQDPYPTSGDAHGLAFSCMTHIPKSLKIIYKCLLKNKLINEFPTTGDLTHWAEQGVLLINSALSTVVGRPKSHTKIWASYVNSLIQTISKRKSEINGVKFRKIFMLWGRDAQFRKKYIYEKCPILEWGHPSPLAQMHQSFADCDNFTRANEMLRTVGPIDWNVEPKRNPVETKLDIDRTTTVVFTDGSCFPNKACAEAKAGYAAVFALGVFKDVLIMGSIDKETHPATNQRAEGTAIYSALKYLKDNHTKWDRCVIITDSEFWIKMFEIYMPDWMSKDQDFNEKANSDITVPMWNLYNELSEEYSKTIEFKHVRSHDKSRWSKKKKDSYEFFCYVNNEYADQCANYARCKIKPGDESIEQVEY